METEIAKQDGGSNLPAAKPFSQTQQGLNAEIGHSNCDFGDNASAVQPVQQKPRHRGRGKGVRAKPVAKAISTFKPLRPEDVWHPRIGARPGNQNALKHGRYTKARKAQKKRLALLYAGIREVKRKARRAIFRADDMIRNRAASNPP